MSFRNPSLTKVESCMCGEWRKDWHILPEFDWNLLLSFYPKMFAWHFLCREREIWDRVVYYGVNILDYLVGNRDLHPEKWASLMVWIRNGKCSCFVLQN